MNVTDLIAVKPKTHPSCNFSRTILLNFQFPETDLFSAEIANKVSRLSPRILTLDIS